MTILLVPPAMSVLVTCVQWKYCLLPIYYSYNAVYSWKIFFNIFFSIKSLPLVKFEEMYFKTALVILKIFLRHPSSIYDFAQTYAKDVNGNLLKFLNNFFYFEKDKYTDFAE